MLKNRMMTLTLSLSTFSVELLEPQASCNRHERRKGGNNKFLINLQTVGGFIGFRLKSYQCQCQEGEDEEDDTRREDAGRLEKVLFYTSREITPSIHTKASR